MDWAVLHQQLVAKLWMMSLLFYFIYLAQWVFWGQTCNLTPKWWWWWCISSYKGPKDGQGSSSTGTTLESSEFPQCHALLNRRFPRFLFFQILNLVYSAHVCVCVSLMGGISPIFWSKPFWSEYCMRRPFSQSHHLYKYLWLGLEYKPSPWSPPQVMEYPFP